MFKSNWVENNTRQLRKHLSIGTQILIFALKNVVYEGPELRVYEHYEYMFENPKYRHIFAYYKMACIYVHLSEFSPGFSAINLKNLFMKLHKYDRINLQGVQFFTSFLLIFGVLKKTNNRYKYRPLINKCKAIQIADYILWCDSLENSNIPDLIDCLSYSNRQNPYTLFSVACLYFKLGLRTRIHAQLYRSYYMFDNIGFRICHLYKSCINFILTGDPRHIIDISNQFNNRAIYIPESLYNLIVNHLYYRRDFLAILVLNTPDTIPAKYRDQTHDKIIGKICSFDCCQILDDLISLSFYPRFQNNEQLRKKIHQTRCTIRKKIGFMRLIFEDDGPDRIFNIILGYADLRC